MAVLIFTGALEAALLNWCEHEDYDMAKGILGMESGENELGPRTEDLAQAYREKVEAWRRGNETCRCGEPMWLHADGGLGAFDDICRGYFPRSEQEQIETNYPFLTAPAAELDDDE